MVKIAQFTAFAPYVTLFATAVFAATMTPWPMINLGVIVVVTALNYSATSAVNRKLRQTLVVHVLIDDNHRRLTDTLAESNNVKRGCIAAGVMATVGALGMCMFTASTSPFINIASCVVDVVGFTRLGLGAFKTFEHLTTVEQHARTSLN